MLEACQAVQQEKKYKGKFAKTSSRSRSQRLPFWSPRLRALADAQLALRQYVLEIECTIVVESRNDDPDEVGDDFASRLAELAPSGEHILGLSVQVLPIPELREALN